MCKDCKATQSSPSRYISKLAPTSREDLMAPNLGGETHRETHDEDAGDLGWWVNIPVSQATGNFLDSVWGVNNTNNTLCLLECTANQMDLEWLK